MSSNNETCYSIQIQTFSPTKHPHYGVSASVLWSMMCINLFAAVHLIACRSISSFFFLSEEDCPVPARFLSVSFSASCRNSRNNIGPEKKKSHQIFWHMHIVLNEVYLQNFLYGWAVNRETNLMSLLNPWFATVMLQYHPLIMD